MKLTFTKVFAVVLAFVLAYLDQPVLLAILFVITAFDIDDLRWRTKHLGDIGCKLVDRVNELEKENLALKNKPKEG